MNFQLKPATGGWLLFIVYVVGILGFMYTPTYKYMLELIWVNLLFTLLVLFSQHKKWTKEFVFAAILIGLSGYLLEVIGVTTKMVFGSYTYGPALGFKIWRTPLMMFVNWLSVVYITRQISEMIAKDSALVAFIAAVLMVVLDYFIEPFAVKTGMWFWDSAQVPVQNYIGWFVFGFIFQYLYIKAVKFPPNKLSLPVYLIQLGFFIFMFLSGKGSF